MLKTMNNNDLMNVNGGSLMVAAATVILVAVVTGYACQAASTAGYLYETEQIKKEKETKKTERTKKTK